MDDQDLLDNIWSDSQTRFNTIGFDRLSPGEQAAICLTNIYCDVQNGGFETYYWNSGGDYAAETPDLLVRIGAPELAEIVRQCNAMFGPNGPPRDRDKRIALVDSLDEWKRATLDSLTNEFFDLPYDAQLRFESYAKNHLDEFPNVKRA